MDLTFQINVEEKFNVRSAAVIKYNYYYLIGKRDDKDYYSIPGGRINFGEDSKRAVIRELKEELNFDVSLDNIKLVRIIENFFYFKDNTKYHEYLFIYEIEGAKEMFLRGNFINLENPNMHMLWYKKEDFLKLNIKPDLIKEIVFDNTFKHIIFKEEKTS